MIIIPEGVEVRLYKDAIKHLEGCKIKDIEYYIPISKMFKNFTPNDLIGYTISNINIKGKTIFWTVNNPSCINYISIHFSMSGSFTYNENKHNIFKIIFEDGQYIFYNDIRHFGKWKLLNPEEYKKYYNNLGTDLLDANDMDIVNSIKKIKSKHYNLPIKVLLMNQEIIGGIGNIYATEALFKLKILPMKKVIDVTPMGVFELIKTAQDIMKQSYKLNGMSVHSFRTIDGKIGNAIKILQIYGKRYCPICNNELIKEDIGGRSSIYCKNCQK